MAIRPLGSRTRLEPVAPIVPDSRVFTRPRVATTTTAPPTAPTAPAGPAPLNPGQRDAFARLSGLLAAYGLSGLSGWIEGKLRTGASEAEITLELPDQPAFQARFPVIAARRAAGLTPVNVADVLNYEKSAREMFRAAGLTSASLTNATYLQGLMAQDVSVAELQGRVQNGLLKVTMAPPEVRVAFGNYFGTSGDAALAQLFLNPAQAAPELEKMAQTAVAGGIGARFGVQLAQGIAREIADTGVSDAAIWQGFGQLDTIRSLFDETISETQDLTIEGEGVAATFGTRPGAADSLQRRAMTRVNQFKGGGGAGMTQDGVVGLGVADS